MTGSDTHQLTEALSDVINRLADAVDLAQAAQHLPPEYLAQVAHLTAMCVDLTAAAKPLLGEPGQRVYRAGMAIDQAAYRIRSGVHALEGAIRELAQADTSGDAT